jgi:lactoylglutathione lyase
MSYKYEFTRLLVSNFKACFLFYRDGLGFQPGYGTENDTYADFSLGAVNISLFDKQEMSDVLGVSHLPAQVDAQDKVCLVFAVENVDAICQQLQAKGIQLTVGPTDRPDWGIRTAHLRDPDGNLIEINQPL